MDGNAPVLSVTLNGLVAASPLTKSAQVSVLAGIWMIVSQGTVTVRLLSVTVPPKRWASRPGQAAPSTVASWMNPVSSNPWMSLGSTENAGSGRVGVMRAAGRMAPCGGFAVPPLP